MSPKLLIVIAVQSALVVSLGGVAIGLSMRKPHAPAKVAKKAPAPEPHGDDEDVEVEAPPPRPAKATVSKLTEEADGESGPSESKTDHHAARETPVAKGHVDPALEKHASPPATPAGPVPAMPVPAMPKEPLEAFSWLDDGNGRWVQGVSKSRDVVAARASVAGRFTPWAVVVTCADGRVSPESVFDAGLGVLATLRLPTLKPDPVLLTAAELLVRRGSPKVLVVLGHEGCDDGSGRPIEAQVTALAQKLYGKKAIRASLQKNALLVLRAQYDLDTGKVHWLDSEEAGHDAAAASSPAGHH